MDNNKNLRDKLNTPPTDLPEELDWANMKEGIFSKMEAAPKGTQGAPQKRNQIYILIATVVVLVLLMIRMCGYSSWYTQDTEATPQAAFAAQEESSSFTYETTVVGEEHLQVRSEGSKGALHATAASKGQSTPTHRKLSMRNSGAIGADRGLREGLSRDADPAKPSVSTSESGQASGEASGAGSAQWSAPADPSTTGTEGLNAPTETTPSQLAVDNPSMRPIPSDARPATLMALGRLDLIPSGLLEGRTTSPLVAPAPAVILPSSDSHARHSLVLSSGISVWDPGYSNAVPERATFESAQLSFSHQFKYEYHTNSNFFFTTGLRMHLLESRFDWSNPINDYKITLEDVVIERVTDALRGEVEEMRGDVEVPVNAERVVRHYNRITLFQLPFGLGTSRTVGPIDFSFELGSSINIVGNSQGRTLVEGSIVELDASGKDLFDSQWGIHGFAGLRMHYSFYDHWNVNLGAHYQKALSNWSVEENTAMRPQILTLEAGVGYRFD